jgi:hypothetical protein
LNSNTQSGPRGGSPAMASIGTTGGGIGLIMAAR